MLGLLGFGLSTALAGWVSVGASGECLSDRPDRHRMETVRDSFKPRDDLAAVEARVRERARAALLLSACAGREKEACDAVQQRVGLDVAVDHERRLICAAALVSSDVVDDPLGQKVFSRSLDTLANAVAGRLHGGRVSRLDVRWSTGCGLGDAGASLAAALRQRLSQRSVQFIVGSGPRLEVRVSAAGATATLEAWLISPGAPATMIGAQSVDEGWLGLHGAAASACASEALAGLREGRASRDGLTVSAALSVEGALCQGETAELTLRPSSEARVQVWTVSRSAEAWLVWDSVSVAGLTAGLLDRRVELGLEGVYLPQLGEETLLILATPASDAPLPGRVGCRRARIDARDLPASTAAFTLPFTVAPPGRGTCSTRPESDDAAASYLGAEVCR